MKIKLPTVALAALLFAGLPLASTSAYVAVSVGIAPPAIPVYQQPFCPAPGYIWTPGYWAYADFGYYWVPGVWVAPPRIGFLWTPGYWGYRGGRYLFNQGYWGPTVGFYGGINYGFGYTGRGYYGGQWAGNSFRYNTAVSRVDTTVITNTYVNKEVVTNNVGSRAGFNGPGGAKARPTSQEQAAAKAEHIAPTKEQRARVEAAKKDPALHAANNHGKPKAEAINASRDKRHEAGTKKQAGVDRKAGAEKAKGGAAQEARGNSVFGRGQGDALPRTKGSQNNAYGKARSAIARESRPAKADRTEGPAVTHARKATQSRDNREVNRAPVARRAAQPSQQGASRRPQVAPRRAQAAKTRQAAPAARERGPAQGPQKGKKKKPAQDEPDSR